MTYKNFLLSTCILTLAGLKSFAQEPTISETRKYLESNGVRLFPSTFDKDNPCAVNLQNLWFYFNDLDASRVFVVEMPRMSTQLQAQTGIGRYAVQINAVNNELRLRTPHPTRASLQDTIAGRASWNVTGFASQDQATRVANAFRHAIKLCGGNGDFFGEKR